MSMNEKTISSIISTYDSILDKLKPIDSIDLSKNELLRVLSKTSLNEIEVFSSGKIKSEHERIIGEILTKCGKFANINDLIEMKTYIDYPDFYVKTNISNPCDAFHAPSSIQKSFIISPVYELNFASPSSITNNKKSNKKSVIMIRRMEILPGINRIFIKLDKINLELFESIYKDLVLKFISTNQVKPNQNDLKYLESIAISTIINDNSILSNECDYFFDTTSYNSYSYQEFLTTLKVKYGLIFNDTFISSTKETKSMWINNSIQLFDNRPILVVDKKKKIIPLEIQRMTR